MTRGKLIARSILERGYIVFGKISFSSPFPSSSKYIHRQFTNFLENCVDGFDVESAHQDTCINHEFYVLFVLSVRLQVYDF